MGGLITERLPLAEAEALAGALVALLQPHCTRLERAGSIRRRKPDVGDIELVCVPRLAPAAVDLFGEATGTRNLLGAAIETLLANGTLGRRLDKNGRAAVGERFKRLTYRGVALDLFCVLPGQQQWGTIFAIRTGCADFSRKLVTPRPQGGWLPTGYRVQEGAILDGRSGAVVPTPEEADVFALCGLPWLDPAHRTATLRPVRAGSTYSWRDRCLP